VPPSASGLLVSSCQRSMMVGLDITTASTSLYLVPLFGVVLAAVLLGERLNHLALTGGASVLIATVLVMKYDTSY
jgi:drug/metabolite transporter (DMT)-like permease